MAITIVFKGTYNDIFYNVHDKEIVLQGQKLTLKGKAVQAPADMLEVLFEMIARNSHRYGRINVI